MLRTLYVWMFFSRFLPDKTRRDCFEPTYGDLLEQYAIARRFFSISKQYWLGFVFTVRTILIVIDCYRLYLVDLLTRPSRNWWRRQ